MKLELNLVQRPGKGNNAKLGDTDISSVVRGLRVEYSVHALPRVVLDLIPVVSANIDAEVVRVATAVPTEREMDLANACEELLRDRNALSGKLKSSRIAEIRDMVQRCRAQSR